eukprot:2703112-Lingulodinium_polyedra.AAC.1
MGQLKLKEAGGLCPPNDNVAEHLLDTIPVHNVNNVEVDAAPFTCRKEDAALPVPGNQHEAAHHNRQAM